MIWFTADHHFGHENIIRFCNRPFSDVNEMDNELIRRWNEVVKSNDNVYHLGDFAFGGPKRFDYYFNQLNGKILFVPGGHDKRWMRGRGFSNCTMPLVTINIDKTIIVLCHYPLRTWDKSHYGSLHLHGHSHCNLDPLPNSMDVGVDCHDFYPINLKQILRKLQ